MLDASENVLVSQKVKHQPGLLSIRDIAQTQSVEGNIIATHMCNVSRCVESGFMFDANRSARPEDSHSGLTVWSSSTGLHTTSMHS